MADDVRLTVEYVPVGELVPYSNNAKEHTDEQIDKLCRSIEEFGDCDPIGVWHDDGGTPIVVEGHGRLMALRRLGYEVAPVISLDHLTDEQRREYAVVHNQLTMSTGWDEDALSKEMADLSDFDWAAMGLGDVTGDELDEAGDDAYTRKVDAPLYEPTGEEWDVGELYDTTRADELAAEVEAAEGLPDEVRDFLLAASRRFVEFRYDRIADFYARADEETKGLMEREALVIIDYGDAIRGGFAKLSEGLKKILDADYDG